MARPMGVVGGGDLGGATCASGTKPAPSGRVPAARAAAKVRVAAWAGVRDLNRAPALGLPPTTARTSRGRLYFELNPRPRLRLRRPAVVAVVTLLVRS